MSAKPMTRKEWRDYLQTTMDRIYEEIEKDEPVATKNNDGVTLHLGWDDLPVGTKLYATPPQRTWVGLTDEEIKEIHNEWRHKVCSTAWGYEQAIEAKLKEKNT
jgi:hypothetical protein